MKSRPDILFVQLLYTPIQEIEARFSGEEASVESRWEENISMPLGMMYLAAYARKHSTPGRIRLLDYKIKARRMFEFASLPDFIERTARDSVDFTPDILAFSVNMTTSHQYFLACLKILKSIWPSAVTVAGGTHATNYTKILLETAGLDYIIRGEAEKGFADFVRQLGEGEKPGVRGLYDRSTVGKGSFLELAEYITDLDEIPYPDWDLIDMETYVTDISRSPGASSEEDEKNTRMSSLITTRGCPFQCTFCSSHSVHGRKVRFRSTANIIGEMTELNRRFGVNSFFLEDDLCTANRQKIIDLLRAMRGLNIPGFKLNIPNGLSLKTLDEELVDELVATNLQAALLAIESGSAYVQEHLIRKRVDLKKAPVMAAYMKSKGLFVTCFFILGFPHETREQMRETVDYAKSVGADWYIFFVATPFPGSEMYEEFVNMGCLTETGVNIWSRGFLRSRLFDTPEVSAVDLNRMVYEANLECNFIDSPDIRDRLFDRAIVMYERIVKKYPFHVFGWNSLARCLRGKGDLVRAAEIENRLKSIIRDDPLAAEMHAKFGHLLPKTGDEGSSPRAP